MEKKERIVERVQFPNAQKVKLLRTAAYAKVSNGKDAMLHSLSAQVSYYNSLIQSNPEWLFCGVYADEALTGTKDNRENFQRLLSECRAGHIDLIITKSISRFARNTVTLLETVRELKNLNVDVYFEEQNIHSISPDGEFLLTLLGSYAQEESYSASENHITKRKMPNHGELPQYFVEHSHEAIIDPEEFELVQAEIERRKGLGKEYSGSSIFSAKIVCACCGGFFGSKVWHSASKYKRTIWQCNHKFSNGVKCETPHLYEDDIKKRFIEVCNQIATDRADFLTSCREIVILLSNTAALDRKIEAQYAHINELTVSMQEFIKENAMEAQDEDFYKVKMAEYNAKKADMEKVLHELLNKRAERLSRKELLEGLIRTMEHDGIVTDTFDGKLWLLLVEKATVGTDGKLTFTLRNGMEIEV